MTRSVSTADDVLGVNGAIARRLAGYESRPEQLQMARAVESAIAARRHLIAEAGTGVGKSFAYLVPAILAAQSQPAAALSDSGPHGVEDHPEGLSVGRRAAEGASGREQKKRRIIVSTHTISLQEQLMTCDIPFLQSVLPVEFSAVLVKGRGNYISLRRLDKAVQRSSQRLLFEHEGQRNLAQIRGWAARTSDGSRSDISFPVQSDVWDEVASEHGDCLGRKCPTYDQCFYFRARRRVWNADLLIVNHALFFSDLALRRDGAALLPDYDTVIFDEAHTMESVAADHLGLSISEGQVNYLLNRLYNDHTLRGLLIVHQLKEAQQLVQTIRTLARNHFQSIHEWSDRFCRSNGRLERRVELPNQVSPELLHLAAMLSQAAETKTQESDQVELNSSAERCRILATRLTTWSEQKAEDSVYWVEHAGTHRERISLMSAPIEVGAILREHLFGAVPSVILTSATLATGAKDFAFFRTRIGLSEGDEIRLGSPFDFRRQARLILSAGMPDPAAQPRAFEQEVCRRLQQHLSDTAGRAFVLFTSYAMLQFCAERLTGWLAENDLSLYCQGKGIPRTVLLNRFRTDPRAVLFGTDSFWQGVNVPGEALQNVIIPRLPFSVPDHPLLEARLEKIRSRGGDPFREYQIPEAVIRLKQGFGRLIRHREDTGRVVILDPRVLTKPYGRLFLESLPDCRLEIDDGQSIEPLET